MQQIQLSDFVGEYGPYQLSITIILFVRYVFLGLMANSGPLMTPDVTYYCKLPMEEIVAMMPNITLLNKTEQELEIKEEFKRICQFDLHLYQQTYLNSTGLLPSVPSRHKFNGTVDKIRECDEFTYDIAPDQGRTMTSEFDLVCDRDYLRSLFQSLLSAAIVVAHVFWGTFSDKYGRYQAQKICLGVSLVAGGLSIIATDFWTFVIVRSICSFGDLGLVVSLTTTVVELVGNQYRGLSVAIVNFGFALGVSVLPYIVAYFEDFRLVIIFTVLCHLVTIPFILSTNESVRWLLTNRKFKSAKKELKRIRRWNKHSTFCCPFWPLEGILGEQSGQVDPGAEGKRISTAKEKAAFELLFKQFIDQIESQNFCDPQGSIGQRESASPNPSIFVDNSDGSEQQTSTPQAKQPKPETSNHKEGQHLIINANRLSVGSCRLSASACRLNTPAPPFAMNRTARNQPTKQVDETIHSKSKDNDLLRNSLLPYRSTSCSQLNSLEPSKSFTLDVDRDKMHTLSVSTFAIPTSCAAPPSSNDQSIVLEVPENYSDALAKRSPQQADCINLVAHQLSFVGRVNRLFRDKQLMIVVFTIVWTTFNSELQYTSYIIINLEVGEDVYLNYFLGGCMEALAAITASLLLSYAPRRQSLITFWLLISLSCFGLSVAHIDSTWAVWLLALAKFSQSCLSSIASVAAYESFPTFLRQSGSGLVFTLGMLGSVFAPLIFSEFDDHAGMDRVLMTFSLSSLTAALLIYFYLKETRNCELN